MKLPSALLRAFAHTATPRAARTRPLPRKAPIPEGINVAGIISREAKPNTDAIDLRNSDRAAKGKQKKDRRLSAEKHKEHNTQTDWLGDIN
jgi:hypothetical protein